MSFPDRLSPPLYETLIRQSIAPEERALADEFARAGDPLSLIGKMSLAFRQRPVPQAKLEEAGSALTTGIETVTELRYKMTHTPQFVRRIEQLYTAGLSVRSLSLMYLGYLGRLPDPGGLSDYLAGLTNGRGVREIIREIAESDEARNGNIRNLFYELIGEPPTGTDLARFADEQTGQPLFDIADSIRRNNPSWWHRFPTTAIPDSGRNSGDRAAYLEYCSMVRPRPANPITKENPAREQVAAKADELVECIFRSGAVSVFDETGKTVFNGPDSANPFEADRQLISFASAFCEALESFVIDNMRFLLIRKEEDHKAGPDGKMDHIAYISRLQLPKMGEYQTTRYEILVFALRAGQAGDFVADIEKMPDIAEALRSNLLARIPEMEQRARGGDPAKSAGSLGIVTDMAKLHDRAHVLANANRVLSTGGYRKLIFSRKADWL